MLFYQWKELEKEGLGEAEGEFIRFMAPRTVDALVRKLPVEGRAALWKEEVYFESGITAGLEKPKSKVETATIAFWPMGSAICIFYGQTQPYSPVNVVGSIKSGIEIFRVFDALNDVRNMEVAIKTIKKPAKGRVLKAGDFEKTIEKQFVRIVDHKNLNADVRYFKKGKSHSGKYRRVCV
jgi:hypothetical protein